MENKDIPLGAETIQAVIEMATIRRNLQMEQIRLQRFIEKYSHLMPDIGLVIEWENEFPYRMEEVGDILSEIERWIVINDAEHSIDKTA